MSSLLFKNDIHNILPHTTTENNSNILNNIKINNLNEDNSISATSSAFMNNINLNTATSSVNLSQMNGGNYINSATSDLKSDIGRFLGGVGWWDDSSTGGGSGGLGKFAPFRFSGLNFCLYSSFNTNH